MVAAQPSPRRAPWRAGLLAASAANWRPAPDVRPVMRQAIMRQGWPAGIRTWALWLADRFNGDGTLPDWCDRTWLTRRSGISIRTCSAYLAQLERAGIIARKHVGRKMPGTGEYRHAVVITAAEALRQASGIKPEGSSDKATDQRNGSTFHPTPHKSVTKVSSGLRFSDRVQDVTRVRDLGAQPRDLVDDGQHAADRALRAAHWPRLARSRSDIPDLRPSAVRFTAPPCPRCTGRHNWLDLCPDQAAAMIAAEGKF